MAHAQYDDLADVWDVWVDSAGPVCDANKSFYVERYLETDGLVVELGVGDGRIAVEAARRGKAVTGVDDSRAMLELCQQRATEAGVADRITLLEADFRDFRLEAPAALVTIPFHSIGHMLTDEDRRACLTHVREQLAPGGRLVLDHFVPDPAYIARSGQPVLRATWRDEDTGGEVLLWVVTLYDTSAGRMTVRAITEAVAADGEVHGRRVRRIEFSYLEPEQVRSLLESAGLEVLSVHGNFEGAPLGPGCASQVWTARRSLDG